jgi:selenocysteine lyase/cysteine desulfurase
VPELRIDRGSLDAMLATPSTGPGLFAFPAQSNFTRREASARSSRARPRSWWDVLVDAAVVRADQPARSVSGQPDFVSISFYKMFGYPTGVGCLPRAQSSVGGDEAPWFAGGTVSFATVGGGRASCTRGSGFEDGTLNYLAIPAVEVGLRHLRSVGYRQHRHPCPMSDVVAARASGTAAAQ